MALGLTQRLTEMSTRNMYWGCKDGQCRGLTTLLPSCANCLEIWEPQAHGTLKACTRMDLPFISVICVGWKHNILHLYHLCNQDHTLLGCDMVLSGRWVPNKCWCLSSKLCGVTHHNITLFSPFLTMPLQHHMWKQGKFTVQSPDEVTETIHSSQQLSKQCEMCWWRVQSSGMWLWCWVSSCYHFQQFYCLHCQAHAVYTY